MEGKRLFRSSRGRIIGGVASGLAKYFNVDVIIFRLIFIIAMIFGGGGLIAYLILWIVLPEDNEPIITPNSQEPLDITSEEPQYQSSNKGKMPAGNKAGAMIIGVLLVLFGAVLLLKNYIPKFNWDYVWPLIFIFAGFIVLVVTFIKQKDHE